jgi:hypothetical protein
MAAILTKIALGVVGVALFLGLFPGKGLRGGVAAIAIVIAAAFVLHFVAP